MLHPMVKNIDIYWCRYTLFTCFYQPMPRNSNKIRRECAINIVIVFNLDGVGAICGKYVLRGESAQNICTLVTVTTMSKVVFGAYIPFLRVYGVV